MPSANNGDSLDRIIHKYKVFVEDYSSQNRENARKELKDTINEYRMVLTRYNLTDPQHMDNLADFYFALAKACFELSVANTNRTGISPRQLQLEAAQYFEKAYDCDPDRMAFLYSALDCLDNVHRQKETSTVYMQAKSCYDKACKIKVPELHQNIKEEDLIHRFLTKLIFRTFAEMAYHQNDYLTARNAAFKSNRIHIPEKYHHRLVNNPSARGIDSSKDLDLIEANCHIFAGASLLEYIEEVDEISAYDKKIKIGIAENVLLKAERLIGDTITDSTQVLYDKLSRLYNEEIFDRNEPVKAFYYLKKDAELGDIYSCYNLGVHYYYGIGTDIDYEKAFVCFQVGANNGIEDSKIMLASCLINGDGCKSDPFRAFGLLKQCESDSVRDNALAMSIINCALRGQYPESSTSDDIISLLHQTSEVIPDAFTTLGRLYHEGFDEIPQSYNQAEYYYQQALLAGVTTASSWLLSLYNDMLTSNQYEADKTNIQQAANELLYKIHSIEFDEQQQSLDEIVKTLKIKRHNFCVAVNRSILEHAHSALEPKAKIGELVQNYYEPTSTVNVATRLLKIGQLSDQIDFDGSTFFAELKSGEYADRFDKLLTKCEEFIDNEQMAIRALANVVTGLSKLYRHYYDDRLSEIIGKALTAIHQQQSDMNQLSLKSVLAASVNWPTANRELIDRLCAIVQYSEDLQKQDVKGQEKANLLYSLVVLDNHLRSQSHTQTLAVDWPYWFQHAYKMLLEPSKLNNQQYSQYSLAYLYMNHYIGSSLGHLKTDKMRKLTNRLQQKLNQRPLEAPNPSALQNSVVHCLYNTFKFRVESEKVINGLPVDAYLPDHHAVVQVNGPKHDVYKDKKQNRQLSMKDRFHEAIVQVPASRTKTVKPDYKVIHIDYQKFNQHGQKHIENELKRAGLLKGKVADLGVFGKPRDRQRADCQPAEAPKYYGNF